MERLSKEQIEAVIQEAKERCPYYGEPDGCNAHGGPLMCCDELDEVGELAKTACSLGPVEELSALVKARDEGRVVVLRGDHIATDGEEALRMAMYHCGMTNNPVTRYTADAIAEKLIRAEAEAAIGGGGDGA